jgi:hypothetical protein
MSGVAYLTRDAYDMRNTGHGNDITHVVLDAHKNSIVACALFTDPGFRS